MSYNILRVAIRVLRPGKEQNSMHEYDEIRTISRKIEMVIFTNGHINYVNFTNAKATWKLHGGASYP
ncbi:unnamed protein product [Sphenostylis stenocarpa]|uniref:Uncharacterized protein n=1 Tax=Sphenostylis stenocarpa TaxID=92480 RepID=A0AA86VI78_9FABA|nr:unnamed protein product [Sphenostylis stenocarpa]